MLKLFFPGEGTKLIVFEYRCSYAENVNACKILLSDIFKKSSANR